MTRFLFIYCIVTVLCCVESFASNDVKDYENIVSEIKLIEENTQLEELLSENKTTKEPGSCQSTIDCYPGGRCRETKEGEKKCICFPGVGGDHCDIIEECKKEPPKCGSEKEAKCKYDPNMKKAYCECNVRGNRFDVKMKKCVPQKPCKEHKDCRNTGVCEGNEEGGIKYCNCKTGTYGDYCENVEECDDNPLCGSGNDVECRFNGFLKKPFCHCLNGTQRFDLKQKKCIERKQCNTQEECGKYGACTDKCQAYEPCNSDDYFEGIRSCHCIEGTSGERCEIVDDCYNKVVDCGTGGNIECNYRYISGISGFAFCQCTKSNQKFDRTTKLCKDCDCGSMASDCTFEDGKKVCTCKPKFYLNGDKCEDCNCGEGSTGCEFTNGKKECICNTGFLTNNGVCEKCDCGENSTGCKFENGLKVCTCKPGFTIGNYGICTPVCNDTHRCANGGRCIQNICMCLAGTGGSYCERIYECEGSLCGNKKDVYCEYDIQTEKAHCLCQNLDSVYDSFDKTCKICSCNSLYELQYKISWESCEFMRGKKICHCKEGYAYHPKLGNCYECDCGAHSRCEFNIDGKQICHCSEGSKAWKGECQKCDCGVHGSCSFENNKLQPWSAVKVCACEQGYTEYKGTCVKCDCGANGKCVFNSRGEALRCECDLGFSEDSKKCKFCYCGPNSTCAFIQGNKTCKCPTGYEEKNGYCKDVDECLKTKSCPKPGMLCINTEGSFKCECKSGYVYKRPDKKNTEPWCEESKIQFDSSSWRTGYILMSVIFILIFMGLIVVIIKIRRKPTTTVTQPVIPLGNTQNYH